ncbi:MAG: hypothetical protein E6I38_09600, partial [Chloroflexi bacterium]
MGEMTAIARCSAAIAVVVLASAMLVACGNGDDAKDGAVQGSPSGSAAASTTGGVNVADFSTNVDNRFFPVQPGQTRVYEGEEKSGAGTTKTRVEETVLAETDTIAGVEVRVVEAK